MAKKIEQQESMATEQENPNLVASVAESSTTAAESNAPAPEIPAVPTAMSAPAPESLAELANRYRVPAWQQAALMRCMGWAEDKQVSEKVYAKALETIKNRPLGGGCME